MGHGIGWLMATHYSGHFLHNSLKQATKHGVRQHGAAAAAAATCGCYANSYPSTLPTDQTRGRNLMTSKLIKILAVNKSKWKITWRNISLISSSTDAGTAAVGTPGRVGSPGPAEKVAVVVEATVGRCLAASVRVERERCREWHGKKSSNSPRAVGDWPDCCSSDWLLERTSMYTMGGMCPAKVTGVQPPCAAMDTGRRPKGCGPPGCSIWTVGALGWFWVGPAARKPCLLGSGVGIGALPAAAAVVAERAMWRKKEGVVVGNRGSCDGCRGAAGGGGAVWEAALFCCCWGTRECVVSTLMEAWIGIVDERTACW